MLDKNEVRAKYKEIRKAVELRAEKEKAICARLLNEYSNYSTIFCYESFGSEVSTRQIISSFLSRGANVYVPLVSGDDMLLANVVTKELMDKPCEFTIVPLLAFDSRCNRLGFGKGYYDRYLATHDTISVGIAFAEQFCRDLPINGLDVPLSRIITPDIIYESELK